jgi:hypothetical protein
VLQESDRQTTSPISNAAQVAGLTKVARPFRRLPSHLLQDPVMCEDSHFRARLTLLAECNWESSQQRKENLRLDTACMITHSSLSRLELPQNVDAITSRLTNRIRYERLITTLIRHDRVITSNIGKLHKVPSLKWR